MVKEINPHFDLEVSGCSFAGRGPDASCTSPGWSRSQDILYRCAQCGDLMEADRGKSYSCSCNALYLDVMDGRFGSKHGDLNILVYKRKGV